MEDKQVVIGIRGKAMQSITASILVMIIGAAFCFFAGFLFGEFQKKEIATAIAFVAGLGTIGLVLIIIGILSMIKCVANDKLIGKKEVLVYDKETDTFIGYNAFKSNRMIVIKNGNIVAVRGSAMGTARELFITYIDSNGQRRRSSFGFARNIDNGALKDLLNQYHNPKIL